MVELSIKMSKVKAKRFKKHLEETHPSTIGNIEIEEKRRSKRGSKRFSTAKQVKAITKSVPNFPQNAADFVNL